jgi:polysaccharide chain length determinant protein (PEP-CTERM system associated)
VLPGKKYTPDDVLRILWHRKWLLIVPFVVASATTYVVARRLPEVYRSETLIQVVPQRIPEDYVRTVSLRIEDRLGAIQQTILSHSRLARIIEEFDLYPQERKTMVMEDVVDRMRDRDVIVKVERGDAFRVTYITRNQDVAQKVAARLGSLFIDENLRDREALAEQTSRFLEGQLADAKGRLIAHEKKLETYRQAHSGELPSQMQANLQAIQNAQMQLQSLSEGMNRDRERRLLLERQLADIEANDVIVQVPAASGAAPVLAASTAEQLEAAIALRTGLLVRYKPDHPDVAAASRRVQELQTKLAEERKNAPLAPGDVPKPTSTAEVLRQNRLRNLQASIEDVDRELANKRASEQRLRTLMAGYQASVDAAPARESELTELMRDYETLQNIYRTLLAKHEDSRVSASVERQQIGEQFKILDPARVPERPFSPNRLRLQLIGSVLGLGLGLVVIGFLEFRDATFKTEEDIVRLLQLPVIALIPMMSSEREVREAKRRRKLAVLAVGVTAISSVAAVLIWKLQG